MNYAKLTIHPYSDASPGRMNGISEFDRPECSFQAFRLGLGKVIAADIYSYDFDIPFTSPTPRPTIAEGQALANEIMRRWNSHEELFEALKKARKELEEYESEKTGEAYNSPSLNTALANAEASK